MFEKLLVKLGILEEIIEEEYDMEDNEAQLERRQRVLNPAPPDAVLAIVRGHLCVEQRERMAEALHQGMLIIVDLRKVDRDVGQGALDFICGVAYATKGAVMRIAAGVFLAMPDQSLVEEWHNEESEEKEKGKMMV